jgi:cystathionine beta-lyase/cystathionine gamma-synthase
VREATIAIHAGEDEADNAPISPSIHVSSVYEWPNLDQKPEWVYSRETHPNRRSLEMVVAALEGAEFGVAFSSGMAGINAALELAQAGDHVLIGNDVYGGTFGLGKSVLPRHGVGIDIFDPCDLCSIQAVAKPNSKLLVFETPSNPMLRVADIRAVVAEAKKLGLLTIFDNTFATPVLQKPLAMGVDVVCHSTTKYLSGHSDVLGGVVVTNNAEIAKHLVGYATAAGGVPGPFDSWLVGRGIKSLVPRMRMHCENAQRVAEFLADHPNVKAVNYPGLASHPGHEIAKTQMKGFGAMLSFEVNGGAEQVAALGKKCRVFKIAASLGGVESLMSYPRMMSHVGMTEPERLERGITASLVRLSVGLEDPDDLIEDLDAALSG